METPDNHVADLEQYQYDEGEADEEGDLVADCVEEAAALAELSKHNLILKEMINEQGLRVECYFCQECTVEYSDINDFLFQHPGVELLNENPEEEILPDSNNTQDKLWDLVEDLKEEVGDEDNPNEYITPDIDQSFEAQPDIESEQQEAETFTKAEPADTEENDHYYCYECQQVFTDLTTAEQHDCTLQQPSQEQLQPQEDQDEFVTDEAQKVVDFACAYCSQVFSSYDDLLNHIANCQQHAVNIKDKISILP